MGSGQIDQRREEADHNLHRILLLDCLGRLLKSLKVKLFKARRQIPNQTSGCELKPAG